MHYSDNAVQYQTTSKPHNV